MDYSTDAAILEYLASNGFPCSSVTRLSGGYANTTWRGQLINPLPLGISTIIVKHSKDLSFSLSDDHRVFTLDASRMNFEKLMLEELHQQHNSKAKKPQITVPEVYHFGDDAKVLVMEDAGLDSKDLKTTLLAGDLNSEHALQVGKLLGEFLTHLHARGRFKTAIVDEIEKHTEATEISLFAFYGRLLETIKMVPDGRLEEYRNDFLQAETLMGVEMRRKGFGITHGDFWPGNVLVSFDFDHTEGCLKLNPLYVVDWEITKVAPPVFDVGQMAAELFLATHFKQIPQAPLVLDAFLSNYNCLDTLDSRFKAAIHFGAHLLAWPIRIPGWGTVEQVHDCTKIGAEYIRHALVGDLDWLQKSVLKNLMDQPIPMEMF
ncbi:kinase-like domain-containing protein [Peziza echinospora]|nr:kinase-like domain-containing protein [Peziza echinospora]